MKEKRYINNTGFTLIEVIVSIAILVIASAGALQAIYIANIVSIEAKETTIALEDARAVLDRVKLTSLATLPEDTSVDASTLWTDFASIVTNSLANQQITVTGGSGANLRQITVTVSWTGPRQKAQQVQLTTEKSLFNG